MNDPLYHQLREVNWRRKLTDAEKAQLRTFLAAHPGAQAEWDEEARLNQLLERLPNVPVASNFTARVLVAAERESAGHFQAAGRRRTPWWPTWSWLPKAALAAAALCACLLAYQDHRITVRSRIAQSLPKVSNVISLSSTEVWEHFDAVDRLSHTPQPDRELLALLK